LQRVVEGYDAVIVNVSNVGLINIRLCCSDIKERIDGDNYLEKRRSFYRSYSNGIKKHEPTVLLF